MPAQVKEICQRKTRRVQSGRSTLLMSKVSRCCPLQLHVLILLVFCMHILCFTECRETQAWTVGEKLEVVKKQLKVQKKQQKVVASKDTPKKKLKQKGIRIRKGVRIRVSTPTHM